MRVLLQEDVHVPHQLSAKKGDVKHVPDELGKLLVSRGLATKQRAERAKKSKATVTTEPATAKIEENHNE